MANHGKHIHLSKSSEKNSELARQNIEEFRIYAIRESDFFRKLFFFPGKL